MFATIHFGIFCLPFAPIKLNDCSFIDYSFVLVLYGRETWSVTRRDGHRLRVSENRVLRRIFGPKREKVAGGWIRLHNDELHNLYASPSIVTVIKSMRMRWKGHVTRMGEIKSAYKILVRYLEGKKPLGKPRRSWGDIRIDLREIGRKLGLS
jgi:hypothetical protein